MSGKGRKRLEEIPVKPWKINAMHYEETCDSQTKSLHSHNPSPPLASPVLAR